MGFGSKLSKSNIKEQDMDKFTGITSFEQWFSPIFRLNYLTNWLKNIN